MSTPKGRIADLVKDLNEEGLDYLLREVMHRHPDTPLIPVATSREFVVWRELRMLQEALHMLFSGEMLQVTIEANMPLLISRMGALRHFASWSWDEGMNPVYEMWLSECVRLLETVQSLSSPSLYHRAVSAYYNKHEECVGAWFREIGYECPVQDLDLIMPNDALSDPDALYVNALFFSDVCGCIDGPHEGARRADTPRTCEVCNERILTIQDVDA